MVPRCGFLCTCPMTYLSCDLLCPIRLELGGHEREVNDLEFKLEKVSAHHYDCVRGGPYLTNHMLSPRGASLTTCELSLARSWYDQLDLSSVWLVPNVTEWLISHVWWILSNHYLPALAIMTLCSVSPYMTKYMPSLSMCGKWLETIPDLGLGPVLVLAPVFHHFEHQKQSQKGLVSTCKCTLHTWVVSRVKGYRKGVIVKLKTVWRADNLNLHM